MSFDLGSNNISYGAISEREEDEDDGYAEFEITNPEMVRQA
jgi:hypothetical protein